jgi:hypothetical protein
MDFQAKSAARDFKRRLRETAELAHLYPRLAFYMDLILQHTYTIIDWLGIRHKSEI